MFEESEARCLEVLQSVENVKDPCIALTSACARPHPCAARIAVAAPSGSVVVFGIASPPIGRVHKEWHSAVASGRYERPPADAEDEHSAGGTVQGGWQWR